MENLESRFYANRLQIRNEIFKTVNKYGHCSVRWAIAQILEIEQANVEDHFVEKAASYADADIRYRKEVKEINEGKLDFGIVADKQYRLERRSFVKSIIMFLLGALVTFAAVYFDHYLSR